MSIDLFSDEALAAERAKQATQADDWKAARADAWKEISAHYPGVAAAIQALKAEFSTATLPREEIQKYADAWRARPENTRAKP